MTLKPPDPGGPVFRGQSRSKLQRYSAGAFFGASASRTMSCIRPANRPRTTSSHPPRFPSAVSKAPKADLEIIHLGQKNRRRHGPTDLRSKYPKVRSRFTLDTATSARLPDFRPYGGLNQRRERRSNVQGNQDADPQSSRKQVVPADRYAFPL